MAVLTLNFELGLKVNSEIWQRCRTPVSMTEFVLFDKRLQ